MKTTCWHFLQDDRRLRWGNQALMEEGKTCRATGKLKMCENGMHGSEKILDALQYAPGSVICLVEIWGNVEKGSDKLVGRYRKVLKMIDGEELLRRFAREVTLHAVKKYWKDAPEVVVQYLETGDESIRVAARDAARVAARDAARDAAWVVARDAAWDAARDAAWDAAWVAARVVARVAASDAARDAARVAARVVARVAASDAQNRLLTIMVKKEMGLLSRA